MKNFITKSSGSKSRSGRKWGSHREEKAWCSGTRLLRARTVWCRKADGQLPGGTISKRPCLGCQHAGFIALPAPWGLMWYATSFSRLLHDSLPLLLANYSFHLGKTVSLLAPFSQHGCHGPSCWFETKASFVSNYVTMPMQGVIQLSAWKVFILLWAEIKNKKR